MDIKWFCGTIVSVLKKDGVVEGRTETEKEKFQVNKGQETTEC